MNALSVAARETGGLLVAEMFGPTIQGEGPRVGHPAVFVRLSRCNLACRWCDTPYTWDWSRFDPRREARRVPAADVVAWVLERVPRLVVVTGGEPLLQQRALVPVVAALAEADRVVEVETNGTIPPIPELVAVVDRFNVSPKLPSAGGSPGHRVDVAALRTFAGSGKAAFKFVATGPGDLDEIAHLVERFRLHPVWVMPEGTTGDAVLGGMREIAAGVVTSGWNLTPRLHVLLWGDQRGR